MINSTKLFFTTIFVVVFTMTSWSQECVRISAVNPGSDLISITNYGTETVDYSMHRFCSLFSYTNGGIAAGVTVLSGDLTDIPAGGSVIMIWPLNDIAGDLSIYLPTGSFGDGNNMIDFVQYGTFGLGRESEAASVGLWTVGDFVEHNGGTLFSVVGCSANGVGNWQVVGIEELEELSTSIYPNPVMDEITIALDDVFNTNLTIEVYNYIGALIEKRIIQNPSEILKIDTSGWPSGAFTVVLRTDEKSAIKKLIKL
ncbi:MAG: hypothetical protein ACI8U0_001847 [Flavobacteriales bacterium]|jgi:hypothetical protein